MATATIGTVSHATLRSEDLIPAFLSELDALNEDAANAIRANYPEYEDADEDDDFWTEGANEMVNDLQDALDAEAPAFCYFGTTEGDGSDFGFWPIDIDEIKADDEVTVTDDLSKTLDVETPYILEINDHGNCTLYHVDPDDHTNLKTVWSIV